MRIPVQGRRTAQISGIIASVGIPTKLGLYLRGTGSLAISWLRSIAAEAQSEALGLELRGPDGSAIATEWIGIRDTLFPPTLDDDPFGDDWSSGAFGAFDPEREAALEKAIEADRALLDEMHEGFDDQHAWDGSPNSDLPRYQIQVRLIDNKSVP